MLTVLDLFSGIGGFSLGLERTGGFETVAFCECEPFCRKVLAKHWPGVPIFPDVRELTVEALADAAHQRHTEWADAGREGPADQPERGVRGEPRGHREGTRADARTIPAIDVVVGGYPCQPFSLAGQRRGASDDRHLWPEMYRLVASIRPRWVIGENVAGHIGMGLDDVLSDLEGLGYAVQPFVVPACAVDAPHRRDRVWVVANDDGQQRRPSGVGPNAGTDGGHDARGCSALVAGSVADPTRHEPGRQDQRAERERAGTGGEPVALADAADKGPQERQGQDAGRTWSNSRTKSERACMWLPEPDVGRVAHGVPRRVDRLRALGNAVVPQVVEMIGYAILEAEQA